MGKLYADSETRSAVDDGLGIVLVFFRHSLSISFEIFIIIFCISLFLLIKMAQAQNANCINENPFNYQDQCILDETKLNSNEKAALIFVKIYASQLNISLDPKAIGDGGLAIGYMQLHWNAAYDAGYRSSRGDSTVLAKEDWPTDGLDGDTNIRYGVSYIDLCYSQHGSSSVYGGDPLKNIISCYNLGRSSGPSRQNESNYVNPVVGYYDNYKNKYISLLSSCHLYSVGLAVPSGFGVPWDVFNPSTLLLKAFCSASAISAQMGPSTYVYHQGYTWNGTKWTQQIFTCTGGAKVSNSWCPNTAEATLPTGTTYYVAYTCNFVNNTWKCGCRDTACTQNFWQLQKTQ